jgi:hypothetical protein
MKQQQAAPLLREHLQNPEVVNVLPALAQIVR